MRKLMYVFIALGIGLSACKKNGNSDPENDPTSISTDEIKIKDKVYKVESIKKGLSYLLNIPKEDLIYHAQSNTFRHPVLTIELVPEEFIDDLEILKKNGYEF